MDDDGDDGRPHQDPVGRGVEDLAQGRDLVPAPGHVAVDPVGGPEDGQEDGGVGLAVGPEEEPEEQRYAGQADGGDEVGDGEDAVERRRVRPGPSPGPIAAASSAITGAVYGGRGSGPLTATGPRSVGGRRPVWYSWVVPRFEPFSGLRYDPAIPLDQVIAPPYDIVDAEERARLAGRHLANAIHVELPVDDPRTGLDRYQAAAAYLARWIEEGILQREGRPAFYAYRMTEPAGNTTTGVIGALGLRPGRRRRPAPRTDHAQGHDRPARPAAGHQDQPLPHLGSVAQPRRVQDLRARRAGRRPRPPTTTGWSTPCGSSTTRP